MKLQKMYGENLVFQYIGIEIRDANTQIIIQSHQTSKFFIFVPISNCKIEANNQQHPSHKIVYFLMKI